MADFKFTEDQKLKILEIALNSAESGASAAKVGEEVERIAHLLSPSSLAMNAVENVERKLEKVTEFKRFTGTVLYVDKEEASNRAVIILFTKPSEQAPNGQELVRTGITTYDANARALANDLAQLGIGQRVLLNVGIEKMDNNNKVRVLHDVQFRGPDPQYNPATPIDWANLRIDPSKLVGARQQMVTA